MMKPLYVSRRLKEPDDFIAWAKDQGFKEVVNADDIHVTIAYSREPVDTSKRKPDKNELIASGGKRTVEPLGNEGAVVLFFQSKQLEKSWDELIGIGASWDYEEYRPHITISYIAGKMDLDKITPFDGPLKFDKEVYEELNTNWKDNVVHEELLNFKDFLKLSRHKQIL